MDNTSDRNGTSFTNKEMWVRVDGKLDTISAKLGWYDVEIALLKERMAGMEATRASSVEASNKNKAALEKQLNEAGERLELSVKELRDGQVTLSSAMKWAAATVIGASVVIDAGIRFFSQ